MGELQIKQISHWLEKSLDKLGLHAVVLNTVFFVTLVALVPFVIQGKDKSALLNVVHVICLAKYPHIKYIKQIKLPDDEGLCQCA